MRWPTADSESHFLCRFARTFPALFSLFTSSPLVSFWGIFFVHFFLHCRRCCNLLCGVFFSGPAATSSFIVCMVFPFLADRSTGEDTIRPASCSGRHLFALNRLFCCTKSKTVETLSRPRLDPHVVSSQPREML
jgi:hypothetical protein